MMIRPLLVISALIAFNSCVQNVRKPVLECILDSYFFEFSMELGNEISLFESHGWTDSTLNLSIQTIKSERLESGKYLFSEYKGAKLYMAQGKMYQDDGLKLDLFLKLNKLVSNNLNWKIVELNNEQEEGVPAPEEFDEIQIIYNPRKKCIEDSDILGRETFKAKVKSQCEFCQY